VTPHEVLTTLLGDLSAPDLENMLGRARALNASLEAIMRNRNFNEVTTEEHVVNSMEMVARVGVAINDVKKKREHPYG